MYHDLKMGGYKAKEEESGSQNPYRKKGGWSRQSGTEKKIQKGHILIVCIGKRKNQDPPALEFRWPPIVSLRRGSHSEGLGTTRY